jgi:hypothetical protein
MKVLKSLPNIQKKNRFKKNLKSKTSSKRMRDWNHVSEKLEEKFL